MAIYIKLFNTHSEYETYITSSDKILPNLSYCEDIDDVHFNHWSDPRVIAKFNVTSTDSETTLAGNTYPFSEMEIDGVVQSNVVYTYTFNSTGEHTVKYTLLDPTSIGNAAFNGCESLTSITIPSSVTSIGDGAFGGCSGLTSINIPSGVTSIGDYAFQNCTGLTNIEIPSNVTSIGASAFAECTSLTSITIPSSVTSIGNAAFSGCESLTSINIPDSMTSIGNFVFYESGLTSITIPNGVTSIGMGAFDYCSGLTSVTIPSSVTSIGLESFANCSNLNSITSLATTAPTINAEAFSSIKTGGTLYVPAGSTGYDVWMGTGDYYLGKYNWTKVEQ